MKRFLMLGFSTCLTLALQPIRAAEMAGPPSPPGEPPFPVVVPEPLPPRPANTANMASSVLQAPPAPASLRLTTNGATVYCADRFLVKPLAGVPVLDAMHNQLGTRTLKTFAGLGNLQVVSVPPGRTVEDCIQRFQQSGVVEYAEPDYARRVCSVTPNDPYFQSQWALAKIQAPDAWGIRTDASKVIVAVIDSGVLYTHADLTNNIWTNSGEVAGNGVDDDGNGYKDDIHGIDATVHNYGPKPWAAGDPLDAIQTYGGHGTPVAGIIGAEGNNSIGVAGVCWKVKLMVVKVIDANANTIDSWDIEGIDYAIENGAQILNLSWGKNPSSLSMREVLTKARNRGVVVVAALGNDNADNDLRAVADRTYPASYELDNIVSVGASASDDTLWPGSNYGQTTCDLMAPGDNIWTTAVSGGYVQFSATSAAAPHVSGVLALLKAQFPQDNYQGLINRLLSSTDPMSAFAGRCVTGGRLNAYKPLITTSASPPNDNYANALPLVIPTGLPAIVGLGNNVSATRQNGEPAYGGHSVWWKWTAPAGRAAYSVHTVGSGFDTVLAAYPSAYGQPDFSHPIGVDDNGCPGGCGSSQVSFTVDSPNPSAYFFLVDGVTSYQLGAVRLTLSQGSPSLRSELRIDETTLVRQRAQGQFQMRIIGPPSGANEFVNIEAATVLMSVFTNSVPYPSPTYAWLTGWQLLQQVSIPAQGYVDYLDNAASTPARFYRCRIGDAPPLPETFSCNTVGYVDRTVPAGWSMLSNPLVGQSFCIPDLFAGVPVGFKVDTWDDYSQAWLEDVYQGNGVWSGPDCLQVRQPPEFGCLVYNPQSTNLVVTFIGHVWQAYYEDAFPVSPAQCIRSMPVPDGGWLGRQLHFQVAEGTTLFKMVNGSYQSYRYVSGVWLPFEPVIDVGDAFWLNTPAWVWKHYDQTWPNGGKY